MIDKDERAGNIREVDETFHRQGITIDPVLAHMTAAALTGLLASPHGPTERLWGDLAGFDPDEARGVAESLGWMATLVATDAVTQLKHNAIEDHFDAVHRARMVRERAEELTARVKNG